MEKILLKAVHEVLIPFYEKIKTRTYTETVEKKIGYARSYSVTSIYEQGRELAKEHNIDINKIHLYTEGGTGEFYFYYEIKREITGERLKEKHKKSFELGYYRHVREFLEQYNIGYKPFDYVIYTKKYPTDPKISQFIEPLDINGLVFYLSCCFKKMGGRK